MEEECGKVFDLRKAICKPKHGGHKGPFQIDEWANNVVCGSCGTELSPMKLLLHFATGERRLYAELKTLNERREQLESRCKTNNKTKCEHCERSTRIDKRFP